MEKKFHPHETIYIRTACGREFGQMFKAMKLVRDEQHNFHIVYKTFSDEFIYSFCNPFQNCDAEHVYRLISEDDALAIFKDRLSEDNARELFNTTPVPSMRLLP